MTQFRAAINASAAIQSGSNWTASPCVIDVDLTTLSQEDRDLLAAMVAYVQGDAIPVIRRPSGYTTCYSSESTIALREATQAGLVEEFARLRSKWAAESAAKAAAEAQAIADWLAVDDTTRVTLGRDTHWNSDLCRHLRYWQSAADYDRSYYMSSPEVQARRQSLKDEVDRRNAIVLAEAQAETDAAKAARAAWIEQYGSARLKRLVAEGIKHDSVYTSEHNDYDDRVMSDALAAERPGWRVVSESSLNRDIADVGVRTLAMLDAARLVASDARLAKLDGKYVAVAEFRGAMIVWPRD